MFYALQYFIYVINALFIDFETILNDVGKLKPSSVFALKEIVSKCNTSNGLRIVSLQPKLRYDEMLSELSQALNLKKTLFFDCICQTDDIASSISAWMKDKAILSFAIVVTAKDQCIGKVYPNNILFCDKGYFSEAHAKDVIWMMSNYKSKISDDSNVWFISDTHFGHKRIIQYCNRPWNHGKDENGEIIATDEDVIAMDNEIIRRWNSVVKPDDIVWHLGDFALGGKQVAERVFPQLNGKINLVMGNHDHWKIDWYYGLGFNRVYDRNVIIHDFVILTHTPLMFLNNNCPFFQIFGHVHDSTAYQTWTKNSCCVCVERHDYAPVSWKRIMQKYREMNGKDEIDEDSE